MFTTLAAVKYNLGLTFKLKGIVNYQTITIFYLSTMSQPSVALQRMLHPDNLNDSKHRPRIRDHDNRAISQASNQAYP